MANHIFKNATETAVIAKKILICQPVVLDKLAALAVHGAEPMALATLNPLPNELMIKEIKRN